MERVLIDRLRARALSVRRDVIGMLKGARVDNLRASFSAVEILVWLYGSVLRTSSLKMADAERDRFVLSRVSAAPSLYAVLAERGFFERDELWSYGRLGSLLQTAPESRRTPGIDVSCGVPGMGVGVALGLALSLGDLQRDVKVFCLLGSEELEKGSTWEVLNRAIAQPPKNLVLMVESVDVPSSTSCRLSALADKLTALDCHVARADGHDYASLQEALDSLSADRLQVILARTIYGKGLPPFREGPLSDARLLDPQISEHLIRALEEGSHDGL